MRKTILCFLLLSFFYGQAQPFEIPLEKGSYNIAFKTYWKFDHSRSFNPSAIDSTIKIRQMARPVLLNVWYPSVKSGAQKQMEYGKYLQPPQDAHLPESFIRSFTDYNKNVSVNEIMGKDEIKLEPRESLLWQRITSTKTNATNSGKAINKKFPLIIYHQGNAASLDDNILLCEFLASHGYIVISSSFFYEGNEYWGVDGRMGSVRDVSFILSNAEQWEPNADLSRAAMIGHSAGAQASHITMAQGSLVFKAMVSLETTQEYHALTTKLWRTFLNPTLEGINKIKGDLLFVAGPHAIFQLADSMKNANRYYYSIPEVRHNDYISQGVVHNYAKREMKKEDKDGKNFSAVATDYKHIAQLILAFVDAKLKANPKAFESYYSKGTPCIYNNTECMEIMPAGKTKSELYTSTETPPGIRQFRQLATTSPASAIVILKKFYEKKTSLTIFEYSVAYAIIDELLETGKTQEATLLYATYKELMGLSFVNDYKGKCDFYSMVSRQPQDACEKKIKLLSGE